jgi:acetyl esterase
VTRLLAVAPELVDHFARQAPRRPMRRRPIDEVRRDLVEWASDVGGEPERVEAVEEVDADGVPARLYRPERREDRVVVWLHGGAWMLGDLDSCDRIARALVNRSGAAVLTVDYRLAPEHRFPAAIDDAWAATAWGAEAFARVAVGGDSAGGNLAAAVALRARDRGLGLALQLLVYPVLDYAVESGCYHRFRQAYAEFDHAPGLGPTSFDDLDFMWHQYVPDDRLRLLPDAAPMRAASLAGVAPAVVITAEHDIVRPDGQHYARWLAAEGVPVEHYDYAGQLHGFFHMLGLTAAAHDALGKAGVALHRALTNAPTRSHQPAVGEGRAQ